MSTPKTLRGDYHARALQQYRIALELSRAVARGAMVRGDRRDDTVMGRAECHRTEHRMLPRDRVLMDLADLREFDRNRERKALRIMRENEAGRVWP